MFVAVAVALAGVSINLTSTAKAAYTIDVTQVGPNVIASGSGALDTANLTVNFFGSSFASPSIFWGSSIFVGNSGAIDRYNSPYGPSAFGTFVITNASSSTGAMVGLFNNSWVGVPLGYVSGSNLGTSTATFDNATLASLGLTTGIYNYQLRATSDGPIVDTFTIRIGAVNPTGAVPEPSTWGMMLLGFGAIGFSMRRSRKAMGITQHA